MQRILTELFHARRLKGILFPKKVFFEKSLVSLDDIRIVTTFGQYVLQTMPCCFGIYKPPLGQP